MIITGYVVMLLSGIPGTTPEVDSNIYPTLDKCITQTLWPADKGTQEKRVCMKIEARQVNYKIVELPEGETK